MALPNVWHHRRVAENSAKACWICYKPSSSVLITPDNKDFFYVCPGHLKDRNFAIPDADEAAAFAERKKKEEMDREIEAVKKEYEEKKRKKKEKRKEKDKEKGKVEDNKKDKAAEKANEEEDKKDAEELEAKVGYLYLFSTFCFLILEQINSISKGEQKPDEGPRIFSLHKKFFQMRLDRIKNAETARRNRERMSRPGAFPSVPSGDPSGL
ncbi:AAA-ATPase Vps4-associated protein 1-domain-containing protein [Lineolata rhizophorae]|uniref:AAA-ATPase Vps4-associated protein 1-domain-containing protein n=1 Tax=Lineolata rhizophorae TaxID=578093 RepID=A0A6A6PDC9_9PEZI|nr:AAA-ATPase Vps4-associated protein 1-domain-containing protein [Lineolata rhizophorae]